MSLFENEKYSWRETYWVLFDSQNMPDAAQIQAALQSTGDQYEIGEPRMDADGRLESVTVYSAIDFAALDISLVTGEEVTQTVEKLQQDMKLMTLTADQIELSAHLPKCDARFDVLHFAEITAGDGDEALDPGALLIVIEALAALCSGVAIDPQSESIIG